MSKNKKFFIFILIITELFLVCNDPYALHWILPLPSLIIHSVIYFGLLVISVMLANKKIVQIPQSVTLVFSLTIMVWICFAIIHSDTSYLTRVVLLLLTYFLLSILYSSNLFSFFWKYNNRFILIQSFLSLVCFIIVGIGLLSPFIIINNFGDNLYVNLYFYGGCFSKTHIGNIIRPSGYLDEPGALAYWAVYGLMFNYAFIKDKILDKSLPYFTISTLSVAYFTQMGFFLLMKYLKKLYSLIPIAILAFIAINYIESTKGSEFDVYNMTIARFEYDEDFGIAGNNRQRLMEKSQKLFLSSPWVGVGGQNYGKEGDIGDNPYEILAKDGIIGLIVSYLPLLLILFTNRRKEVLIALLVIMAGYMQRPLHINFMHYLYLWSFALFSVLDAKAKKRSFYTTHSPNLMLKK